MMSRSCRILTLAALTALHVATASAQEIRIPRAQDEPPGPALSPQEAIEKMEVPEGFSVELVAAEPDIVNPVAMTFDEKGRIWICESLEYPRRSPGPGKDRVKVLEDTDGDGRVDKSTVFADGLNIPSGIAVGYGGVWVANAPDILFLQDTDGDLKADTRQVVVTGFGRDDTHELPNSFTWGPDGWLYGLNGVFNHSHVKYSPENPNFDPDHPGWKFTCAMFRIHPRTREFQVFAEGTSNPWGIAFDPEGSAFVSACVIDHLWHITESGYYVRQGGPYPPFTWRIGSIVDHAHQKAAYCGLEYFDSDAYPEPYRDRLYMGNIHGNCINVDELTRDGSSYFAEGRPDFLTANDAWFMPVEQKTGPDGCLYVLDWYDRYHCYQDANADPEGVDRLKGRLYRIRYRDTPRVSGFDLSEETDKQLIRRLHSPNVYFRRQAQRLLTERNNAETRPKLRELVRDSSAPRKARMHALWTLVSTGPLKESFHRTLLSHSDPSYRAWAVRAAGNDGDIESSLCRSIRNLTGDESPDVLLQVAVAARKIEGLDAVPVLLEVLANSGQDQLIPHIVWENLYPLLEEHDEQFLETLARLDRQTAPGLAEVLPRSFERLLSGDNDNLQTAGRLLGRLVRETSAAPRPARRCLALLTERVQSGVLEGDRLDRLRRETASALQEILKDPGHPLHTQGALLAASWGNRAARDVARRLLEDPAVETELRLAALDALIAADDPQLLQAVETLLAASTRNSPGFRGSVISSLGRLESPQVADVLLEQYPDLEPQLQPKVVELLTQRAAWAQRLLQAIGNERIPSTALNVNQVRGLLAGGNKEVAEQVRKHWGTVRDDRDPQREKIIAEMRQFIRNTPGDPFAGRKVFEKVCAQCHTIYGEGTEVGPDITRNGRNSFEQLLSNVFDPNLVIGASYQAHTVVTEGGRVLTGLLVEESPGRIVLRVQGGKEETVPRDEVDIMKRSEVSMMPERLEDQLSPQEIADLFAFLTLDRPPEDPDARRLPGVYAEGGAKRAGAGKARPRGGGN